MKKKNRKGQRDIQLSTDAETNYSKKQRDSRSHSKALSNETFQFWKHHCHISVLKENKYTVNFGSFQAMIQAEPEAVKLSISLFQIVPKHSKRQQFPLPSHISLRCKISVPGVCSTWIGTEEQNSLPLLNMQAQLGQQNKIKKVTLLPQTKKNT